MGRGAAAASVACRTGDQLHRDDASRRFSRAFRLGIRRRFPVRADPALWAPRRSAPLCRSGARARIAVILDVVYNHLGPDGNYLTSFSPYYFTDRYANEWGQALNFDGPNSGPVREFFIANAGYWIEEFHFDGLRLDATQQIFDASPEHLVAAATRRIRSAAGDRASFVVAENERQEARLARAPKRGGYGLDAIWNDDFHHCAHVAMTGRSEAYYGDYQGSSNEFAALARHGFLFQGQRSAWQQQPRGHPALDLKPVRFVTFLKNHDQVANSLAGTRGHLLTSPGRWRAHRLHAAVARHTDAISRPGILGIGAVLVFR